MVSSSRFYYGVATLSALFVCNGVWANQPTQSLDPFKDIPGVYVVDNGSDLTETLTSPKTCNTIAKSEDASQGCAVLLKPGTYGPGYYPMGYYTQIVGLGQTPKSTVMQSGPVLITPNIPTDTRNFWRDMENITLAVPDQVEWNVSQGSALRSVDIKKVAGSGGNLNLYRGNNTVSGGFMANVNVEGAVDSGPQQQWFSRNSSWGWFYSGQGKHNADNGVFVNIGQPGAIAHDVFNGTAAHPHYEVKTPEDFANTPRFAAKPYLIYENKNYFINVPQTDVTKQAGYHVDNNVKQIPASQFRVVSPAEDNKLQQYLNDPTIKGIILTPGVHHFNVTVAREDMVILGLGFPKIVPSNPQQVAMKITAAGVKLGGVIFEDTDTTTSNTGSLQAPLLQVDPNANSHTDPSALYDINVRIIGNQVNDPSPIMVINQDNLTGDNLWLWVKDHWNPNIPPRGDSEQQGHAKNGLLVTGNNVRMFGLASEHFEGYQVKWVGNNGANYFFQSELPYLYTGQLKLPDAYQVTGSHFIGVGLGAYAVVGNASADAAFALPSDSNIDMAFKWVTGAGVSPRGFSILVKPDGRSQYCLDGNSKCYLPVYPVKR